MKSEMLESVNGIADYFRKEVKEPSGLDDSGERISYGEGMAVREPSTGKGRYDLVSPFAMRRLAQHYERGDIKYSKSVEIEREVVLSAIENELGKTLSAQCAVSINYIVWECAEVAMRSLSAKETQSMCSVNGRILGSGTKNTQNGSEIQTEEDVKTRTVGNETEKQDVREIFENAVYQKMRLKVFEKNRITNVQSAEEALMRLQPFTLTMIIKQAGQEDFYVVGATTDSECLKNLLILCKKLSSTFSIRQQTNSSMKACYLKDISTGRNWEKGMPFSRYVDSAKRHLDKFVMGMTDEDHLAAAAWNLFAIMHHQELGQTELDDMPHYNCTYEHE